MEEVITSDLRLKAARAARELAAKVNSGIQFGRLNLFRGSQPCCVLGHLLNKIGVSGDRDKFVYRGVSGNYYAFLKELSGMDSGLVFGHNDNLFNGAYYNFYGESKEGLKRALSKSLIDWAESAEQLTESNI